VLANTKLMTKFVLLLFSLYIFSISNAQDFTEKEFYPKYEIGINTTNFIKTFLSLNSSDETVPSPLQITFKKMNADNKALRLQFGLNAKINSEDSDIFQKSTIAVFDFKVGLEKRNIISSKWFVLYGLDGYLSYLYSKNKTTSFEDVEIIDQSVKFGPSLFFGFAFNINERMYLSTESNFQILASRRSQRVDFSSSPSESTSDTSAAIETNVPTNLNLIVKF